MLFNYNNILYSFNCLPFGLSTDPFVFTKFLGFNFNTIKTKMSLPTGKKEKIVLASLQFLRKETCSIRDLAKLIAACPATQQGWAHVKILECTKYLALKRKNNNNNYNELIYLRVSKMYNDPGVDICERKYFLELFSDSSKNGWGAVCNNIRSRVYWFKLENTQHINVLELLAAYNDVISFTMTFLMLIF